jgi:hypothetical protein
LGEGGFGNVFEIEIENEIFAVKIFKEIKHEN